MSTIAAPVTVGEFRNLLEQDVRAELIGGEVIEMARARKDHEIVKANANGILFPYWQQSGIGKIFIETMCELTETDALVPDLALRVMEQIDVEEESFHGAPDLAVEVVSSETAERLQHKVNLYLRHGARSVWVIYPNERMVVVHRQSGIYRFTESDTLTEPELLPGFSTPVAAFFDRIK